MLQNLNNFAAECTSSWSFFGLSPWYKYINDDKHFNGCDLTNFRILPGNSPGQESDVPLVLLAIVDDLLRIAALFAVGFVIVGTIQLITSQGDPEGAGKAQSTIINALIGLAVAIVSVAFVSFIGRSFGGS